MLNSNATDSFRKLSFSEYFFIIDVVSRDFFVFGRRQNFTEYMTERWWN